MSNYYNPDGVVEIQRDNSVIIRCETKEDFDEFVRITKLAITPKTEECFFSIVPNPMDSFF